MIISLYRGLLQQAKLLPDAAATAFYVAKVRTSFRKEGRTPESSLTAVKRIKEAEKLLRQLQAANSGHLHAIERVLQHTYGRRGAVKHRLLKPFVLSGDSSTARHSFPPALASLVTSDIAHTSSSPTLAGLSSPPLMPARANPDSEEARLLGRLSERRINKIRLRYWNEQVGKLKAPIAVILGRKETVVIESPKAEADEMSSPERMAMLEKAGLSPWTRTGRARLDEMEAKTMAPLHSLPRLPRRLQSMEERARKVKSVSDDEATPFVRSPPPLILAPSSNTTKWRRPKHITPRLLRRRFQGLLYESPVVTISLSSPRGSPSDRRPSAAASLPSLVKPSDSNRRAVFSVSRSEHSTGGTGLMSNLSLEDLWWIDSNKEVEGKDKKRSKKHE